jgi:hypothetical protein
MGTAPETKLVSASHEMTRTRQVLRFLKQLSRWTDSLEAVMFDNDGLSG